MEVVRLTEDRRDEWDQFLTKTNEAWFRHTTSWLDYATAYAGNSLVEDRSFFIQEGAEVLAVCPVFVEEGTPWEDGACQLSIAGGPLPFPAVSGHASDRHHRKIVDQYVSALSAMAEDTGAVYVQVRIPSVAPCLLEAGGLTYHPLIDRGFIDLPFRTQVVDLEKDEAKLLGEMRNSHRHDIRDAEEVCEAHIWDAKTITKSKFRQYQELHRKDAGRVTRPQSTFDEMLEWVNEGRAVLVEAEHGDTPLAFAVISLFGKGAVYGSSCKDPDRWEIPGQHLIQWEAMRWLKGQGLTAYDLGIQWKTPQWFQVPADKQINISKFKRGFGGRTVPLLTAEFHYDEAHLEEAFRSRISAYGEALQPRGQI